ncbi:MAG: hypothetical protein ACRCUT_08075 [Spirochaetota bacterium]
MGKQAISPAGAAAQKKKAQGIAEREENPEIRLFFQKKRPTYLIEEIDYLLRLPAAANRENSRKSLKFHSQL